MAWAFLIEDIHETIRHLCCPTGRLALALTCREELGAGKDIRLSLDYPEFRRELRSFGVGKYSCIDSASAIAEKIDDDVSSSRHAISRDTLLLHIIKEDNVDLLIKIHRAVPMALVIAEAAHCIAAGFRVIEWTRSVGVGVRMSWALFEAQCHLPVMARILDGAFGLPAFLEDCQHRNDPDINAWLKQKSGPVTRALLCPHETCTKLRRVGPSCFEHAHLYR